ncbi:MAG: molybdopterin-dependent oxidoreductase [Thermoleophilia bacterium]
MVEAVEQSMGRAMGAATAVRTTCAFDCPDRCSVLCVRAEGAELRLSGDPRHPFTRGLLCRKIRRQPARLTAPERILHPWVRADGRGSDFRAASWEEALDRAAAAVAAARAEHPASVISLRSAGSMGASKEYADYVFGLLGARSVEGSLCAGAGSAAVEAGAGSLEMNDPAEIDAAEVIVLWGKNPRASSIHTAAQVVEARRRGAYVLAVTPDAAGLDGLADHVITVRPGTDRFLALAAVHLLLRHGGASGEASSRPGVAAAADIGGPPWKHAENRFAFEALLARHPLPELLAACEVSEAEARLLADAYSRTPRVATIVGWGVQRYLHGGEAVRALQALAFLGGTLGRKGGGFYYSIPGSRHLTSVGEILTRAGAAGPAAAPPLTVGLLGRQIPTADPPVRVAWLTATNIVNQGPDSSALQAAFAGIETVIAVEAFWTETARAATIVLPPTLWLEEEDVIGSYWRDELAAVRQVVPAPGGCRSDFEILRDLAARLGLEHPYDALDDWLRARLPAGGPTLEELREEGWRDFGSPGVAYRDGFKHPGGRFRLTETLSVDEPAEAAFPLHFLTLIRGSATHSQMLPHEQTEPLSVRLHPDAAARLGLVEGARARVVSRVGRLEGIVRLDRGLHPAAVACPRGGWIEFGQGVNLATEAALTDLGEGTAFYSTRVRVEPA